MSGIILHARKHFAIRIIIFSLIILSAFTQISEAQKTQDETPIKVNTYLVNIPVIASDVQGHRIAGLKKENFSIIEDGVKQNIDFFSDKEAPMNIIIVIDASCGTTGVLDEIKNAAKDFINILRPEDKAVIVNFNNSETVLSQFTSDRNELHKAVDKSSILLNWTANMHGATYEIVKNDFAAVEGRNAIIILSNGFINAKSLFNRQLLEAMTKTDVYVYPIMFKIDESQLKIPNSNSIKLVSGEKITADELRRRRDVIMSSQRKFIESVTAFTGGKTHEIESSDLKKMFQEIADELKKQYLIGYYPQNIEDGKPHQVTIEVDRKDAVVRSKRKIKLDISN